MKKNKLSLITLIVSTALMMACAGQTSKQDNSSASSGNDAIPSSESSVNPISTTIVSSDSNNNAYAGDSNESSQPISSSNGGSISSSNSIPSISSSEISSSIDSSSSQPVVIDDDSLDGQIAQFLEDLNTSIPSLNEYGLEFTVIYYYAYEQYVIVAQGNGDFENAYLNKIKTESDLVSQNDDDFYTVEDYGYLYSDPDEQITVNFFNNGSIFCFTLARSDGGYGELDVSNVDTSWYVDYVNFQGFEVVDNVPINDIKESLAINADIILPSFGSSKLVIGYEEEYADEEGNYYPTTFYLVFEGDQISNLVQLLKAAGFEASLEEKVGTTIDWDTWELVDYTYYEGTAYDAGKNVYISIYQDNSENTIVALNNFSDVFANAKTTNTDWTDEEKALMNETLHQVLPFMAFGDDYELYDDSDEEWNILFLVDSYYEDLSEDYIALLLADGFVEYNDPDYGLLYKYDNGSAYIEIFVYYDNGNCLEIYFEPSKLGTLDSLKLNAGYVDIVVGVSFQLEPSYTPSTATYPITWSSNNESLATVDKNGLVTIKSDAPVGSEVIITASTSVGKTATCTFNIHDNVVTGIAFLQNEYTVIPGAEKYVPAYTLMPYGVTTNDTVTYRLGNGENGLHYNDKGELWADADAVEGTEDALVIKINDFEDVVSVRVISSEVKNTLTGTFFGIKKGESAYNTYSKSENGASYEAQASAGNNADSGNGLQLRSKNNNSGVIGNCEGRTCKSITFNFDSNTQAGRSIEIYASNTPFAITDMYGSSVTKVGTVNYDSSNLTQTYTFTTNYSYIGFRSADGALYLKSVEVIWG